jgi:hypothetical protein
MTWKHGSPEDGRLGDDSQSMVAARFVSIPEVFIYTRMMLGLK